MSALSPRQRALARLAKATEALAAPVEWYWDEDERDCRKCKQPTHWRTRPNRGAPVHPSCEPMLNQLTPIAEARVIYDLVRAFDASVTLDYEPRRVTVLPVYAGQCSWCTGPRLGYRITGTGGSDRTGAHPWRSDEHYHCKEHLHWPYIWPGEASEQ